MIKDVLLHGLTELKYFVSSVRQLKDNIFELLLS